jgi:HD-like signal output (HDOD) protein
VKVASARGVSSIEIGRIGVEEVASRIDEISTLPTVALRIMQVAGNPSAGAADLKSIVESDPALCVRVLRCVNCAAYSLRREVVDLGQAIAFIGFDRLRDLAVTATVSDLFRSQHTIATYDRAGLWRHLACTAICARMIAVRTRIRGFEDAFLAGLLHDIGIILMDQHCNDSFKQVILSLTSETTLGDVERELLGWDHAELGHEVGKRWRLPRTILTCVRNHHKPETVQGPEAAIAHCVALANLLVTIKGMSSVGINLVGLGKESLEVLHLTKDDLKVFLADLDREVELHQHIVEIQKSVR